MRSRGLDPAVYAIGKKGVRYFRFRGVPMQASWQGFSEVPTYERAEAVGRQLIEDFADAEIDELHAAYTDFRSAFTLRATSQRFLPIAPEEVTGKGGPRSCTPSTCSSPSRSRSSTTCCRSTS